MSNRYPLERPVTREKIKAFVMEGLNDAEIARSISTPKHTITRQAVYAFRRRHAGELQTTQAVIEKQVGDYAIAQKVNRIAALDNRWTLTHQVILERAADPTYRGTPGYATGLLAHDVKAVGSGEGVDLVDVFKVDTALLAEIRAIERAAAEELGQMPRAEADVRESFVLIRERIIERGSHLEPLG